MSVIFSQPSSDGVETIAGSPGNLVICQKLIPYQAVKLSQVSIYVSGDLATSAIHASIILKADVGGIPGGSNLAISAAHVLPLTAGGNKLTTFSFDSMNQPILLAGQTYWVCCYSTLASNLSANVQSGPDTNVTVSSTGFSSFTSHNENLQGQFIGTEIGVPLAPKIDFLNRMVTPLGNLTVFKWEPVTRDVNGNFSDVTAYKIYRTSSPNLEDPQLIDTITALDSRGFIDSIFSEIIDGFRKYCVTAVSAGGESQKSCATTVVSAQMERLK